MRRRILAALIAGTALTGLIFHTIDKPKQTCELILADARHDHSDLSALDYSGATWYYADGSIFGYANFEDSNIYNHPNCGPDYIED